LCHNCSVFFSSIVEALTVATVIPIVQLDFPKSKHYGVFVVFADFQSFCEQEKLGLHYENYAVDRF